MRSGRTISAVRTAGLTPTAAASILMGALAGEGPVAFVEDERDAEVVESLAADPECAVVVLTSGSTGKPKAVGLTGPALTASATTALARIGAPRGASWSLLLPLHHIAGIQVLFRAAINEGAIHTLAERADFTAIVPTQLQRALHGDDHLLEHLKGCRSVLVGGAALAPSLREAAVQAGVTVITTYGMTETSGGCIYDGRPLPGVEVRIDELGCLAIRGPMLASGYLNGDSTAFADGWFHTSDLGRIKDGVVSVAGRVDAIINSGGEKISLAGVEEALRHHPLVIDAIASGAPDATWGEKLVVGVVASGAVSLSGLRDHVTHLLGRVHAPRGLVMLHTIPTTSLGKPDRAALLTHALDEEI